MIKKTITTDLSARDSFVLEVAGKSYSVVQANMNYGVNKIPAAICMLAVGRDTRSPNAATYADALELPNDKLLPAKIWFKPSGQYAGNIAWPAERACIFDGFVVATQYRRVHDKLLTIVHLYGWIGALEASSCLNQSGHPANPGQLNAAAILAAGNAKGTLGQAAYTNIGQFSGNVLNATSVDADLWTAMKSMFVFLTQQKAVLIGGSCIGQSGKAYANTQALEALQRIEGDVVFQKDGKEAIDYPFSIPDDEEDEQLFRYAAPIKLITTTTTISNTISKAIADETVGGYAQSSFWDRMITRLLPAFGLNIIPLARRAIVTVDLPTYNKAVWRTVYPWEYDSLDMTRGIDQPLRGAGVAVTFEVQTQKQVNDRGLAANQGFVLGGCFINEDIAEDVGKFRIINSPPWLRNLVYPTTSSGTTAALKNKEALKLVGADAKGNADGQALNRAEVSDFYNNFAHAFYVNTALKHRSGILSGRLRFDIAPGSIIKIAQSIGSLYLPEKDSSMIDLVAHVNDVTISINAEAPSASTTFSLSHIRSVKENEDAATSIASHPIFGSSIHGDGLYGAPIVSKYNFVEDLAGELTGDF